MIMLALFPKFGRYSIQKQ